MNELYLVAQNIRSLFNVGSLFRCADVFGVTKLYLGGYTGYPPRKEISKTALQAEDWVPWERHWHTHKLIAKLKAEGVYIVALETDTETTPLPNFKPKYPMALIVGNEKNGISPSVMQQVDEIVTIPMLGKKESLNVAIAASIALYTIRY